MAKKETAIGAFLRLVSRVHKGSTARSENDLSSKLAAVLNELGLFTVIDTGLATGFSRKRPDLLGYVASNDADLVLPAEIVIESKKPSEVAGFKNLAEAATSDPIWDDKTFPYIKSNISRVNFFVLTTFTHFCIIPIDEKLRRAFASIPESYHTDAKKLRASALKAAVIFQLEPPLPGSDPQSTDNWRSWLESHARPSALKPPNLSAVLNSTPVHTPESLEHFADRLASIAAGANDDALTSSGLFPAIRSKLPDAYGSLSAQAKRDLNVFLMTQHPGASVEEAVALAKDDLRSALDEFVAASIHSLVSRFFAFKVIEDAFCIGRKKPLIEPEHWIFNTDKYDGLSPGEIQGAVYQRLREIKDSSNPIVSRFELYGSFFDWTEAFLDPVVFRSLVELFVTHNFSDVAGDVLGRFYELYAQRINRTKRRELGQYYTPMAIVDFMWAIAYEAADERKGDRSLTVLDPGMGSATFLTQGARVLGAAGVKEFWKQLTGFDISAQVIGIAHVNLYMAVLSQLTPAEATEVTDLHLFTTDALDPRNGTYLKQILPLLSDERYKEFIERRIEVSAEVKRKDSYFLVIGNPPYRNNSSLTLRQVSERFPRLLRESDAHAEAQVRNIRDDYAWFFAAADHYLAEDGLICFIVSDSFAGHPSYRYFREDLLKHYQILRLIRLGSHIFQDVGPRISFAIILIDRRANALSSAEKAEPFPYSDLHDLAEEAFPEELGTDSDPRFVLLRSVVTGDEELPTEPYTALAPNFALYPQDDVVPRVRKNSVPIHEKKAERLFVAKWPGIITSFDTLFKADTREELQQRVEALFVVSQKKGLSVQQLTKAVSAWGSEHGFDDDELERLSVIGMQIRQSNLKFDASKMKRSFSGAMPNSVRWYPPQSNTHFLYYEPQIHVPRNKNVGKQQGWGSMEQWREPETHLIAPKLIYTTASKPAHGLKAFVVEDEWYVKLHGGTSQQFNYTGIESPLFSATALGEPNNLTPTGIALLGALATEGRPPESLLFYVASVYNSDLAAAFLEEANANIDFGIRIPKTAKERKLVGRLADLGLAARNLSRMAYYYADKSSVPADQLTKIVTDAQLASLGCTKRVIKTRGYKSEETYELPPDVETRIGDAVTEIESEIDDLVNLLYS